MKIEGEKWYTAHEVAGLLNVTEETVKNYCRSGRLAGKRIGPRKRWHIQGRTVEEKRTEWGLDVIQN